MAFGRLACFISQSPGFAPSAQARGVISNKTSGSGGGEGTWRAPATRQNNNAAVSGENARSVEHALVGFMPGGAGVAHCGSIQAQ